MTPTTDFTREFANLVWLLVHRTSMIAKQKETLRRALAATREGASVISMSELNRSIALVVETRPAPTEIQSLSELSARMAGHSVSLLDFSRNARAADVLGIARVLASPSVHGDDGAHFDSRVVALAATTVDVRMGRVGFVRRATPVSLPRLAVTPPGRTPPLGTAILDAVAADRPTPATPPLAARMAARTGQRAPDAAPKEQQQGGRMVEAAFSRPARSRGVVELFCHLEGTLTNETASRVLDELSRTAEDFARGGLWIGVADVLTRVIARESLEHDAGVKRVFLIHLRHLFNPGILRGVAGLLPKRRELRDNMEGIFRRAGESGAEVLLELMISSNLVSERRAYRSTIARCPACATPLVHLLDDRRWYVVRNAADLLGEMHVAESERKLISTLRHSDARVRRSATTALARLATPRALQALHHVLEDSSPAVRLQAVHGLTAARSVRSVPALLQALERESEVELQHALLGALGSLPTDPSVERLVHAAQPGSLLSRKPTAYRVAAVHALGAAATHAASGALRALQVDRDREVRSAVARVMADRLHGVLSER